ncbi:MAG: metal-dependent transcriptional regulator [Deltaproteobacteria bacterium]|nr:metal-dependent transcriptional regulator [Deltaproteobacteria bacterium]MBN2672896.1 metal-dependent transcriptional regulator [Deltaproteobacteria bacterium]
MELHDTTLKSIQLSESLEDYMETIFELVRDNKLARIKDIAKARDVRSASVIPAMRRLSEMGLITYEKREYIDLTPAGERVARRVYARHRLLTRFFRDILGIPNEFAQKDACALEHSLSDEGMDHIVRFFEFIQSCPEGGDVIARLQTCSLVNSDKKQCTGGCAIRHKEHVPSPAQMKTLRQIKPGESCNIIRINGTGAIRQRILDMGLMPGINVYVERVSPAGDPMWIKFQGSQLSLRLKEAETVLVNPE